MMDLWKNKNWKPMLLSETNKPFDSTDYIFELKFDGIRVVIFVSPKKITVHSRNNQDITHLFPELQELTKIVKDKVIFDGEIVTLENNKPDFSSLQKRLHIKNQEKIKHYSTTNPVIFVCFDILYKNKNLTSFPLLKRKEYLNIYKDTNIFIKTKTVDTYGLKLFKSVKKLGLEGIVAKKKTSKYYINKRTDDFIKIKNIQEGIFLIGGYELKKNNILSLSLGEYISDYFHFVGKVSISKKASIYRVVLSQKETKNYFQDFKENIHYIKPTISCKINFLERTKNNHLRHPVYKDI